VFEIVTSRLFARFGFSGFRGTFGYPKELAAMSAETVFIHCQTFSRRPNRVGQCVAQVIGEGLRTGGYHLHVENPKPPVALLGLPDGFQQMHDDYVARRNTQALKNGVIHQRAIRADRHTLFSIVASYPVPTETVQACPEESARFRKWTRLTLQWVRQEYGDQLKVAIGHIDETYPHIHCWLLADDPGADAALLHPGKVAKRRTETRLKSEGTPPREAVKAGNRALKSAMRAWIDAYHRKVGAPLGMLRDGPKRRRLSRAQHQAEIAMGAHYRNLEEDRVRLEAKVAALKASAALMAAQQKQLESKAGEFVNRAKQHHARMRAEVAQINALGPMLDAIVTEIENRTIAFDPGAGWRMSDPAPFQAAGRVWVKLEPAVRRLIELLQAAEDGRWNADLTQPEHQPFPCLSSLEARA